jgi:hypothetical protein
VGNASRGPDEPGKLECAPNATSIQPVAANCIIAASVVEEEAFERPCLRLAFRVTWPHAPSLAACASWSSCLKVSAVTLCRFRHLGCRVSASSLDQLKQLVELSEACLLMPYQ